MQETGPKPYKKCFGLGRREIRLMSHVSCLMFRVTVSSRFIVRRQDEQVGRDLAGLSQLNYVNRWRAARARHERPLSAASSFHIGVAGAYGCAQAECWLTSRSDGIDLQRAVAAMKHCAISGEGLRRPAKRPC
jgi:hypothetical protein